MLEKVKEAFSQYTFLTPADLFQLAALTQLITVKKGEHIIKVNTINHNAYMILKGLVRYYVLDHNKVDKTLVFMDRKNSFASLDGIMNGRAAKENIIAMEDCLLLQIDMRAFNKLADKNIRLLKFQNREFQKLIIKASAHLKNYTILSPEQRYEVFIKEHETLVQRVPQKYIASYLGVTPTSLSRLKARYLKK